MKAKNGVELFARKCTCTGRGMNKGFVVGEEYAIDERCADILSKHNGHNTYKKFYDFAIETLGKNQAWVYYTEWNPEEEEDTLYDIHGFHYHSDENGEWIQTDLQLLIDTVPETISFTSQSFEIGKLYLQSSLEEYSGQIYYLHHGINSRAQIGMLAAYVKGPENKNIWFIFKSYYRSERCFKCVYFE